MSRKPPTDEDAEAAWAAEGKRRLEEVRSGRVKPVPWEEAEKLIFGPSNGPNGSAGDE
jgi:putative addiction module component (TIGR02574 family)